MKTLLAQASRNWEYINPTLKLFYGIEDYFERAVLHLRFLIEDIKGSLMIFRPILNNLKKLVKPLASFYATPV